jgi:thymidylate synthase (FAD)
VFKEMFMSTVTTVPVLDHGFVTLRNISGPTRRPGRFDGDDVDPAQAARMSFGEQTVRPRSQDLKLCDYLMKNWHTSPFEMVEIWLEMKLPIFVARQFVRHRTVSLNEISGRYVTLPADWYIPDVVGGKPISAKQGQSDTLSLFEQQVFKQRLRDHCTNGYAEYLTAIDKGVAPEHARLFLHLNHYTHWLWKQDLHNMLNFLRLRDHSHAQIEAQIYAKAIDTLLREHLPESMVLYDKYRRMEG